MYVCICVYVLFVPDIISVKQCPLEKDCKYIYIYIYISIFTRSSPLTLPMPIPIQLLPGITIKIFNFC